MKLDFNVALVDFGGNAVKNGEKEMKLNEILVGSINMSDSKGNAFKFFDWCLKLNKAEVLDLDKQDQELLKKIIEESPNSVLVKGRLLEVFDAKKD